MSAAVLVIPQVYAVGCAVRETVPVSLAAVSDRTKAAETPRPELAFYRKYTEGMLRRYLRMSMESGRVPSLLGREMFRGKVTAYRIRSFEDVVIFVQDVERCLRRLETVEWQLLERIVLQEYTQSEAAELLGMSLRTVVRRLPMALDRLTEIFLETGLLEPIWESLQGCQGEEASVRR